MKSVLESEETEKVHLSFVRYILLASLAYLIILKGKRLYLFHAVKKYLIQHLTVTRRIRVQEYPRSNSSSDAGTNEIMRHRYNRLDIIMPTRTRQFLTCIRRMSSCCCRYFEQGSLLFSPLLLPSLLEGFLHQSWLMAERSSWTCCA